MGNDNDNKLKWIRNKQVNYAYLSCFIGPFIENSLFLMHSLLPRINPIRYKLGHLG